MGKSNCLQKYTKVTLPQKYTIWTLKFQVKEFFYFPLLSIVWPPYFFFVLFLISKSTVLQVTQITQLRMFCWPPSRNSQTFHDLDQNATFPKLSQPKKRYLCLPKLWDCMDPDDNSNPHTHITHSLMAHPHTYAPLIHTHMAHSHGTLIHTHMAHSHSTLTHIWHTHTWLTCTWHTHTNGTLTHNGTLTRHTHTHTHTPHAHTHARSKKHPQHLRAKQKGACAHVILFFSNSSCRTAWGVRSNWKHCLQSGAPEIITIQPTSSQWVLFTSSSEIPPPPLQFVISTSSSGIPPTFNLWYACNIFGLV